jgi:CBS-domain-containing membrane protein
MFAIYGTSGLMYKGPIEDLRKVAPSLKTSAIRPLNVETDRPVGGASADGGGNARGTVSHQALQTYSQVQKPVTERRPLHTVLDVMTTSPVLLPDTATVEQGWKRLFEAHVGQAPVVNAQGLLVGLLTRAELMRPDRMPQPDGSFLLWRALMLQPVTELMVSPVASVSADTELRRLAWVLIETGLPGVPVVDADGRVEGFVSRTDILKAVVHDPPLDLWAG